MTPPGDPAPLPAPSAAHADLIHVWQTAKTRDSRLREATPTAIEPLQVRKGKATVWRIHLAGAPFQAVIAKRSAAAQTLLEQHVYRDLLEPSGLGDQLCLGVVPVPESTQAWLVVEDVAGEPFSPTDSLHRSLAADWLGRLHQTTRHRANGGVLPDVGPGRYQPMLRSLVEELPGVLTNPSLENHQAHELEDLTTLLVDLLDQWRTVELICARSVPTLVHGSISVRNMRVLHDRSGPRLRVFDWGAAGWGTPARDVAKLLSPRIGATAEMYDAGAPGRVLALAVVGGVFRAVEHLTWVVPKLAYDWIAGPLETTFTQRRELARLVPRLSTALAEGAVQ